MGIVVFHPDQMLAGVSASPVPVPVGEPVAMVRSAAHPSDRGTARSGVWECSPGVWRRQVTSAEFCFFLEGEAIFEPDHGTPVHISAGQAAFFPRNSLGIWKILAPARKVFLVFEEAWRW